MSQYDEDDDIQSLLQQAYKTTQPETQFVQGLRDRLLQELNSPSTESRPRLGLRRLRWPVISAAVVAFVAVAVYALRPSVRDGDMRMTQIATTVPNESVMSAPPRSQAGLAEQAAQKGNGDTFGIKLDHKIAIAAEAKQLVSTGPEDPMELGHSIPEASNDSWFVHVWDLTSKGKSRVLPTQVREEFAVTPDGQWLVTPEGRKIDLTTSQEERMDGMEGVKRVCFSPDGKSFLALAGSQKNGTMRVYDWPAMKLRVQLADQYGYMFAYAFSDDSQRVVLVDKERRVRLWDINTGASLMVSEKVHSNSIFSLAISPDGTRIVSSAYTNEIWMWDTATGNFVNDLNGEQQYGIPSDMRCLAFSPNGQFLAGGGPQNLILWDASTGKRIKGYDSASGGAAAVWFSSDQSQIVTIHSFHSQRNEAGADFDVYPDMKTWTVPEKD